MNWEIVYIPEKITSNEQATVDVFASMVDPKITNTLIRQLNQVAPLESLRHVKRVRKISFEGKVQLSVILCSVGQENHLDGIPDEVLQLMKSYQLHPFAAKVAKHAALSKEEWAEQCKLWPTSFHPPTYNIDGINGFSEEDSFQILNFMKMAIGLTKPTHLGNQIVNAVVIVDPSSSEIIATACDQTLAAPIKSSFQNINGHELAESFHSHDDDSNEIPTDQRDSYCINVLKSYTNVSCLYPWSWTRQQQYSGNSTVDSGSIFPWHPLHHAALVAFERAAARDRRLFPSSELSRCHSDYEGDLLSCFTSTSTKRQKTVPVRVKDDVVSEASTSCSHSKVMKPYLCTGFDIYLVWEPCVMCAMALVHQRIRRVFYAFPNPNAGALGSVHRLQGERSLNHHYAVFRVLVPEDVLANAV